MSKTVSPATGKKFGVSELGADVINYISHATQQRLQNLLEKVSQVAQQKNSTLKVMIVLNTGRDVECRRFNPFLVSPPCLAWRVLQEDERYEQVGDVRAQLKFFEQLDQMEKQRKEEQEREILLKAAKVRAEQRGHAGSSAEENYPGSVSLVYISSTGRRKSDP